jgi:hypothetical protein
MYAGLAQKQLTTDAWEAIWAV